ncbi:WGR domain-containing protein [Nocardia sp. IFM 10818]
MGEKAMLVKTEAGANSNKFYEVTLNDDGTVLTRWGRVGVTKGQQKTLTGGHAAFEAAIRAKQRRGYKRVQDGSSADAPLSAGSLRDIASRELAGNDPVTGELVRTLADLNRHHIQTTSGGLITATRGGGMETALGPVTATAIADARAELQAAARGNLRAVDQYLMLVPQKMPRQAGWQAQFTDPGFIADQVEFLNQLDAAITVGAGDARVQFRHTLRHLDDNGAKVDALRGYYQRGINHAHPAARLRLHRAWELADTTGADDWNTRAETLGNVRWFWHGSRTFNVLSILHKGLYVPPRTGSTAVITGRMFGDGIYVSDQSTKALNYSYGTWSGARDERCFLFDAQVALGKELRTTPADRNHDVVARFCDPRNGFNSLSVRAGTCGVINNETIVPDAAQVRLRYLLEFRR